MMNPHISLATLYQSPLLLASSERLIHGFTGKPASFGGPDTPNNPRTQVLRNRVALLEELGFSGQDWAIGEQVHGHRVGRAGDRCFSKTDAIITLTPGEPVMCLVADCVPILLYDPVTHAAATAHAGWRGTAQQIVQEAVISLQNAAGSKPEDIQVAIGPAIDVCCFQVSLEVAEAMAVSLNLSLETMTAQGFLQWDADFPQNPRMDLKVINRYQLGLFGITQVDILPLCTRCSEKELFSFRRGEDGRNSAFVILR